MGHEIIAPQSEEPKSLENFLKKRFPIGYVRKLFRKKAVRLNGRRAGAKETVQTGDRIQLFITFEKRLPSGNVPPPARFGILFEDNDLLVINKPAGLAVHEGKEVLKRHSVLGILESTYRPKEIVPRLVHRIDKETSGLLIVAKNEATLAELEEKFERGGVEKKYLVLVVGRVFPKKGKIDLPLPGRAGKLVSASTLYKVEKELPGVTLVRVKTETGRMHQIRLHFAEIGRPVVMDDEHGDFSFNKQFRKAHGLKRQFLHASSMALEFRGKKRTWTAPLPEDLTVALDSLEALARSNG
ncbi:MAG: RluA family pseudouridine synthase [Deltaproteobacteria bacterium]|nr:RluA family pseudouridine synthase [Deltaproteobacteria bacterium]